MPRSLQLLLVLAAAACYRNPETPSQTSCSGTRLVVVSNGWNRAVEVYAWQGGAQAILGIVTVGASGEFPMPTGSGRVGLRAEGGGNVPRRAPIDTRYICR